MKKTAVGLHQSIPTHCQATEVAQPADGSLYDPSIPVSPKLSSVLIGGFAVVAPGRNNGVDMPFLQKLPGFVAVIGPVGNKPFGFSLHVQAIYRRFQQFYFRRGRRVQVYSQRSTRAIDQNHALCSFSPLGFPDFRAPFLAGKKVPSTKHSSHRIFFWSLSWLRKALHKFSKVPSSSHCLSLLQQVVGLPYWGGSSLQGDPVHRIQRIPSKQRRSSARGRPPLGLGLTVGRCGRILAHWASVSSRHAIRHFIMYQNVCLLTP